jgi:glycosyltransferase 2 family protein
VTGPELAKTEITPGRRALRIFWKAALLLLTAFLAWKYVDFRQLGRTLGSVSPAALLLLVAIVTIDRWMMAYKWHFIGESLGIRLNFLECVKAYYTATMVGFVMPTSLGGDLTRALRLTRDGQPKAPVFATIVMEKVVNTAASIAWAWIGFFYLGNDLVPVARRLVLLNLGAVSVAGAAALAFSVSPGLHGWIAPRLQKHHMVRLVGVLDRTFTAYRGFAHRKGRLALAVLLGFLENTWDYALYVVAGVALHVHTDWGPFLAVVVLNHLVRKLALYLNSWSVVEAATVAAFGFIGVAPHQALAISLLRHAVNVISTLPGVLIFVRDRRNPGPSTVVNE